VRAASRRIVRHVVLAALFAVGTLVLYAIVGDGPPMQRLSIATAYVGLGFLAATLLVGPFNERSGRPNPASTNLRRDIGIWTAVGGIAHTVFGLQVHMRGEIARYFIPDAERALSKNTLAFLTANYTGLAATILLALLLGISNDVALRTLGTTRWKRIQRWNSLLFALVAAHGALYLAVDKASWILIVPFILVVALVAQVRIPRSLSR
jgi:sulfoxide reductase heme-binding subunit YedZ